MKLSAQRRGQSLNARQDGGFADIRRGIGCNKIPPSLERLSRTRADDHKLRIEHQSGTRTAVGPCVFIDIQNTLTHAQKPADYPVHGATLDQILGAAGPVACPVAQWGIRPGPLRLHGTQVLDIANSDRQFGQMEHGARVGRMATYWGIRAWVQASRARISSASLTVHAGAGRIIS